MTETPEQRARRLGLIKETPEERAQRLGLDPDNPESLTLDIRVPSETTHALPHNRANRAEDTTFGGIAEGTGPAALGILASGAQAIPGMERLQAGVRSVARGQSYDDALKDMRGVTDDIPAPIKLAAQIPAMAAGAGVMGKFAALRSPTAGGAIIGAADQALDADPMSLEDRLARTAVGGAGGAAVGKTLDVLVTGGRAAMAKPFDKAALARRDAMGAADRVAYGGAEKAMAAAGGSSPSIKAALVEPTVAPFTKAVRSTQEFVSADDATVLREAYKLMSERQRTLGGRLLNSADFKAGSSLEKKEIDAGKKALLAASKSLGDDFFNAVKQHAVAEGEIAAMKHGQNAANQLMGSKPPRSERKLKQGADALRRKVPDMTLEERLAAEEGALGELKAGIGIQPNAVSMGGALTTAIRPHRVAPLLRNLDTKKQRLLDDLVRAGLLGTATITP